MVALATIPDLNAVTGTTVAAGAETDRATRLIQLASAAVERWCNRRFTRVVNDVVDIVVHDQTLFLPNGPVEKVPSVVDPNGVTVVATTYQAIHGHLIRSYGWWPNGTYAVTYTHGFNPIPDAVVLVVCQVVARYLANPDGVRSEVIGDVSVVYTIPATGVGLGLTLGPVERNLLGPYRVAPSSLLMVR